MPITPPKYESVESALLVRPVDRTIFTDMLCFIAGPCHCPSLMLFQHEGEVLEYANAFLHYMLFRSVRDESWRKRLTLLKKERKKGRKEEGRTRNGSFVPFPFPFPI